jgi:hypothetical protein
MNKGAYTTPGRLADVLALIQVLALDKHIHRSEEGISKRELVGPPSSSPSWTALAREHPEFFRVAPTGEHVLSLVARHVLPEDESEERKPLPADFTFRLLQTAIDLHDRQVTAASRWKDFVPVVAALIGGIFGTVSALATLWLKSCNLP